MRRETATYATYVHQFIFTPVCAGVDLVTFEYMLLIKYQYMSIWVDLSILGIFTSFANITSGKGGGGGMRGCYWTAS